MKHAIELFTSATVTLSADEGEQFSPNKYQKHGIIT